MKKYEIIFEIIILALIVAGIALFLVGKNKKLKWSHKFRFFISGVIFLVADFFFFLDIYCGKKDCYGFIAIIAIIDTIRMISFSVPYSEILQNLNVAFFYEFIALSFVTPLAWGTFIISFFPYILSFIRFNVYRFTHNLYFFSELNKNSLMLAKSLKETKKKEWNLFIFCGVGSNINASLIEEAEISGFAIFQKSMEHFVRKFNLWHKWFYFGISEKQDESLEITKKLLETYSNKKKPKEWKIKIYLYSEQVETNLVTTALNKNHIPLVVINRNRFFANDLIFRHPLTEKLRFVNARETEKVESSVLVFGAGKLGLEVVKNFIWSSELGDKYSIKIEVFDRNADYIRERFFNEREQLGEIKKKVEEKLNFHNVELFSDDFMSSLKLGDKKRILYVCICLGDDELNIKLALFLRRYFMRNSYSCRNPFIAIETKNDIKSAGVLEFSEVNKKINFYNEHLEIPEGNLLNYHFHSFGTNKSLYSAESVDSSLLRLAFNSFYEYECAKSEITGNQFPNRMQVKKNYYSNELFARESIARVLHIPEKLFLLGENVNFSSDFEIVKKIIFERKELIKGKLFEQKTVDFLSNIEHERWCLYMFCEKWVHKDFCQNELELGIYVNTLQREHYCMQNNSFLEKSPIDFGKCDKRIVKNMLKILGIEE